MNIVHIVESLAVGGLEHVVIALADWQRKRGHQVRIVCLFEAGALAAGAPGIGIEVLVMHKRSGLDVRALLGLRSAIGSFDADIVHTHNAVAHYYAALAVVGLSIDRIINTRHGMGPTVARSRLDRLYSAALIGTHAAVSVCKAARTRYVETGVMPKAKAVVVPNGVAVERIAARHADARAALLAELRRPTDALVVGTVGRLSPVKDHETLLRAISLLRLSGRPVELVIVGDGETHGALRTLADSLPLGQSVHFLGMRSDVAQLLPAFDIFALTSISEGYSLALVEAAAAALPIVATAVGGNADIVAHGSTGLLVAPRQPSLLSTALSRFIDDPALRDDMGARGRRWALAHGSLETMGQAYMNLYSGQAALDAHLQEPQQGSARFRPSQTEA